MDIDLVGTDLVTKSDIMHLASWDRTRSTEQLLGFIARREAAIADENDGT